MFRELNERLKELNEVFNLGIPVREWICECANHACVERVELSADEYEAVRHDGTCFFVAPNDEHVWPDVERVTERNDRYWVVEKTGHGAELAKRADPRSDEERLPLRT